MEVKLPLYQLDDTTIINLNKVDMVGPLEVSTYCSTYEVNLYTSMEVQFQIYFSNGHKSMAVLKTTKLEEFQKLQIPELWSTRSEYDWLHDYKQILKDEFNHKRDQFIAIWQSIICQ